MKYKSKVMFAIIMAISLFSGVAVAATINIYARSNNVGPYIIDNNISTNLIGNLTANTHYPSGTVANLTAILSQQIPGVTVEFRNEAEAPLAFGVTNSQGVATVFYLLQAGNYTFHAQPIESGP